VYCMLAVHVLSLALTHNSQRTTLVSSFTGHTSWVLGLDCSPNKRHFATRYTYNVYTYIYVHYKLLCTCTVVCILSSVHAHSAVHKGDTAQCETTGFTIFAV
jgi:hypothetical protein